MQDNWHGTDGLSLEAHWNDDGAQGDIEDVSENTCQLV